MAAEASCDFQGTSGKLHAVKTGDSVELIVENQGSRARGLVTVATHVSVDRAIDGALATNESDFSTGNTHRLTGTILAVGPTSISFQKDGANKSQTWAIAEDAKHSMNELPIARDAIINGSKAILTIGQRGDRESGIVSVITDIELLTIDQ